MSEAVIEGQFFFNPANMPHSIFLDDSKLTFGTGEDVDMSFDGTDLLMKIDGTLKISEKSSGIDFVQFNSATRQVDLGQDVAGKESILKVHGTDSEAIYAYAADASTKAVKIWHDDVRGQITTSSGELRIFSDPGGLLLIGGAGGYTGAIGIAPTHVLFPVQAAGATPPAYVAGGLFYNTTTGKLMIGGGAAWEAVTSA